MRIWRACADEAPQVASLLAGFRDHLGRDWPSETSIRASVERLDLFVRDSARGAGLGRALTEAVLARALGFETGKDGGQDLLLRRLL